MPAPNYPKRLLQALRPRLPEMVEVLRRFVEIESPSLEKQATDRCCTAIAAEWAKYGVRVERIPLEHRSDHLRMTWWSGCGRSRGQLLVLGDYSTVYATGTL